jgi:hypothetical protein
MHWGLRQDSHRQSHLWRAVPRGAPDTGGRRIGSLGQDVARFHGGPNVQANLVWSCLWCNTWPSERVPAATDRGAIP